MFRIFFDTLLKQGEVYQLNEQQAHHLINVLRKNEGDKLEAVSSTKEVFIGEIKINDKPNIKIIEKVVRENEPQVKISLYQGIPKKDKFEQIIKMGTEIGAVSFTSVAMERSVVKIKQEKIARLLDRWNKIALSAAKQAKRDLIPLVNEPIDFDTLLSKIDQYDLVICFYENEQGNSLKELNFDGLDKIALIIGPEGGFSEREIALLNSRDVYISSLGKRILRTETAGATALSIILYLTGDI